MKNGNDQDIFELLIIKYLSGEANGEEASMLLEWLEDPDNKLRFEQFEHTWYSTHPQQVKKPSFSKDSAWNKISGEISGAQVERKTHSGFAFLPGRGLKIAASLLAIAVCSLLIFLKLNTGTTNSKVTSSDEPEIVTFPDNSKVTLYRHTTIDFPEKFQKNIREVSLTRGEAFFEIARDQHRPFVVHTALADIKVIGTEFNVSTDSDRIIVSVKEGKVMIRSSTDSIYLSAGSTATIREGKSVITNNTQTDNNSWGYATHRLIFKDISLGSVIRDIEKAYPCSISVSNGNINKCRLTATFDNDSVDNIVNLIAESLNLTVKRNDKIFTLEGEGCP